MESRSLKTIELSVIRGKILPLGVNLCPHESNESLVAFKKIVDSLFLSLTHFHLLNHYISTVRMYSSQDDKAQARIDQSSHRQWTIVQSCLSKPSWGADVFIIRIVVPPGRLCRSFTRRCSINLGTSNLARIWFFAARKKKKLGGTRRKGRWKNGLISRREEKGDRFPVDWKPKNKTELNRSSPSQN